MWIAFSAVYPQAFDENFHFGLIKVYSHHWLPFLSGQPAGADAYGAVARDPSYLYHYLMSFPYRLLALFVHGQAAQVIILRLVDIGLVALGLTLFRRVLLRVGVSARLANVSILIFALVPIVPQLAAQVSYDDLLFPLVAWSCLQTFNIVDQLKHGRLSCRSVLVLLITLILTSLVKYAFLPIFVGIGLFLLIFAHRRYRHNLAGLLAVAKRDFHKESRLVMAGLLSLLLLSVGLFGQREGINLIKYHSVVPDCAAVLNVQHCSAYSPWYADYTRHQKVLAGSRAPSGNIVTYAGSWFYWMWYRLFFAVNGPASHFANKPPLLVPGVTAAVIAAAGGLALLKWCRRLFRDNLYLILLLVVCGMYALALFVKGYATYQYTAVLENMNGRYLVPILLPLAAMIGLALSRMLSRRPVSFKLPLAAISILLLLQGGGTLTFILRSDETWYWPNSHVVRANNTVRSVAKHVVLKSN